MVAILKSVTVLALAVSATALIPFYPRGFDYHKSLSTFKPTGTATSFPFPTGTGTGTGFGGPTATPTGGYVYLKERSVDAKLAEKPAKVARKNVAEPWFV